MQVVDSDSTDVDEVGVRRAAYDLLKDSSDSRTLLPEPLLPTPLIPELKKSPLALPLPLINHTPSVVVPE